MARAFLFVLDSFGIGGAADAERYGDAGANTLAHIAEACAEGRADRERLRQGPLFVPHMASLGLGKAAETATGLGFAHFGTDLVANAFHATVGLGKTHLLQAIAAESLKQNPKSRVVYLTAEYFMSMRPSSVAEPICGKSTTLCLAASLSSLALSAGSCS